MMADRVKQYQELIGQLRWAVGIGRLDILLEKLLLSNCLAMLRARHLKQAFRIFGYLKVYLNRKLGFDENRFQKCY